MIRSVEQLPLGERVKTLTEMVQSARAQRENFTQQEADYLDQLARAEAEVTGKGPGWEGVQLSGLVEQNPYQPTGEEPPPAPRDQDIDQPDEPADRRKDEYDAPDDAGGTPKRRK